VTKLFVILGAIFLGLFAGLEMVSAEGEETPFAPKTTTTYWVIEYPVTIVTEELVTEASTTTVVTDHVVVPGDTLSQIAQNYLGSADLYPQIAQKNSIGNPDLIFSGQIVSVEVETSVEAVYKTVTRTEIRQEVIPFVTTQETIEEEETQTRSSGRDEKIKLIETLRSQSVLPDTQIASVRPAAMCILKVQACDSSPLVNADQNTSTSESARTEEAVPLPEISPPQEPSPPPEQIALPRVETWAWPVVAPLSDYFGVCDKPYRKSCHTGIDIDLWSYQNAGLHAQITASKSGTVTVTYCETYSFGCRIEIDHGDGFTSMYAHLSEFYVQVGQQVSQGEVIALSGLTGTTTGEHLHFEIHYQGVPQNPLDYLP
jgi:murein DD-endopeptidase MepM/ murein hydrolase activator NlpD